MHNYLILTECCHYRHPRDPGKRVNFSVTLFLTSTSVDQAKQQTIELIEKDPTYQSLYIGDRRISKIVFEEITALEPVESDQGVTYFDLGYEMEDRSSIFGDGFIGGITSLNEGLIDFVEF